MSPSPPPTSRYTVRLLALFTGALMLLALALVTPGSVPSAAAATCGTTNAALNKPATSSSVESAALGPGNAVDGNANTRWSSAFSDPQWLQVDLGSSQQICQVVLTWETAYGKAFQIQVSNDASNWTSIYSTTTGTGGTQTLNVSGTGRYIRMYGTARGTQWGYSLWEFAVYTASGPIQGGGDLGPNVLVFDPSMSSASIQSQLDSVFNTQQSNQFGTQRYALLFKPGNYNVNANIGFYTSIAGLGRNPDDVTINGAVTVDAQWFNGNATQNFWRSAENLAVNPSGGSDRWAVAQGASFRRMHVHGALNLAPTGYGWASGGYMADSAIDGQVTPYSQQQWMTRDSQIGGWGNGVWNMVFSGVAGAPAQSFPNPPYTTLDTSPVTREKPYLYVDQSGAYNVFVPALRQNSRGTTWSGSSTAGSSIPLSQFYVAKPTDTAATINAALAQGLNLLFTPGVYHVAQPIQVTRPDTVVLGIGYPTLIPDNGVTAMNISDVDGVKVSGILFDAGTVNSPSLLQVGTKGASHAADPIMVQDVFLRVGGADVGKVTDAMVINSNDTILDNIWDWRADHGTGIGWTTNTSAHGLIVNGDRVTAYGLAVEHFQQYQVIWNGNAGRTIFYQSEMPYDPPSQTAWRADSTDGYASYKVADSVTSHEAWGVGVYCYFNVDPTIVAARGFEVPNNPAVKFHDLLTVSLGGKGSITHVINNTGGPAAGTSTTPSDLVAYP